MKLNDYYSTPDLTLATVISLNYPIDSIEWIDKQRAVFYFLREDGLDDLVESYWRRNLQIEPIQFANQLKVLKTRIRSA